MTATNSALFYDFFHGGRLCLLFSSSLLRDIQSVVFSSLSSPVSPSSLLIKKTRDWLALWSACLNPQVESL